MLKKLCAVFIFILLSGCISGCDDNSISGKYDGLWTDGVNQWNITTEGDHYKMKIRSGITGGVTKFYMLEKNGNLIFAQGSGELTNEIMFRYKDKNTLIYTDYRSKKNIPVHRM